MSVLAARERIIQRLIQDLQGPVRGENEAISEKPSEHYVTGILYPQNSFISEDEDEKLDCETGKENASDNTLSNAISLSKTQKPSAAGLSFALENKEGTPQIEVLISFGKYRTIWQDDEGNFFDQKPEKEDNLILLVMIRLPGLGFVFSNLECKEFLASLT